MHNHLLRVAQIAGGILIAWIVIVGISEWSERRHAQALIDACLWHDWRALPGGISGNDWCISMQADVESGARNSDGTLVDPEIARARVAIENLRRQREARDKCDTRSWFGLVGGDRCPPGTP